MERNLDRKTLSFSKGMTNIPSDLLSDDTELAESNGFIYRDGEMKPIQHPKEIGNIPYKLMYVHKSADYENLIAYDGNSSIYWYKRNSSGSISSMMGSVNVGKVYDIKSVGNTLIVATEDGLHYILYKGGTYKDLGTELPKPHLNPSFQRSQVSLGKTTACELKEIIESTAMKAVYNEDGSLKEIVDAETVIDLYLGYFQFKPIEEYNKQTSFQDAVQGHASAVIAKAKENNYFLFPFFIRFALKLFDGSYARISAPIACYPTISKNCYFVPVKYENGSFVQSAEDVREFIMYPFYGRLYFTATIDGLDGWDDIVKELVVFASDDVMPFYLNEEWSFKRATETDGEEYINFPNSSNSGIVTPPGVPSLTVPDFKFHFNKDTYAAREVIMPKYKSDSEIIKELVSKSQFYKLFSVKTTSKYVDGSSYEAPIDKYVVENITTQEQLGVDDYYGWTRMVANTLYPYNKRINLLGVNRYPFKGFNKFGDSQSNYASNSFSYYVHIVSDGMDTWVKSDEEAISFPDYADAWFYYPDPNATEAIVWNENNGSGMKLKLESHPMLNSSYSFNKLPTKDTFEANVYSRPTVDESAHEVLDSQIFTSVVNNPFVFEASGDNTVGTGKILGIVANTDAISQGQFGQYPLLVFTSEGVYGMSVNSEGLYSATYPISREVCNNDSPFIPTDKLVYFVSEKGLMAATGGTVGCMSEQMRGRVPRNFLTLGDGKFKDFLVGCMIAYDYRDSMLRIFGKGKDYQYVYNMIDKTFSMINSGITAQAVVNDYPDNLIQSTNGKIYSLINKPEINDDGDEYNGSFVTRPLKLGGSIYLKSLRAVKHLTDCDNGKTSLEIYGSNDCKHWQKFTSLGGKPYKYFTFKYKLTGFKANDSFAGTIVEIQPRRNDKMR